MPYSRRTWTNHIAPPISATNLNAIEQGIVDEESARTQADNTEAAARAAADTAEAAARVAADDQEAAARAAAVTAEATARTNADNAEAATRAAADTALDGRLDTIEALGPLATDVELGAEATARIAGDAAAVQRANHTGVQAISTVTGLQAALDGKEPTIPAGTYVQRAGSEQDVSTPLNFDGGKPWWDARSLATLQAAITAATSAGGGIVRVAVPISLGTTSVTLPDGVDLLCVGLGVLSYSGTGAAVTFSGQNQGHSVIRINRTNIGWEAADLSDTTSVGVKLYNCNWGEYVINEVQNFETGLLLHGDSTGTAYNRIPLGRVNDNKRGIRFLASGGVGGHANANTFVGGVIRISNFGGTVGSRYIDLSQTGNGETFVGVCLEGSAPEKVVHILSTDNVFIGCRTEGNGTSSWHFTSTAFRNWVIGCPGVLGPADAKFLDESTLKQNVIIGGRGMVIASDSNNAAFTSRALVSNADASYKSTNISGLMSSRILGGGQFEQFAPPESFARVRTDVTGGPGGFGGFFVGRGNIAPAMAIGSNAGGSAIATADDFEVVTASKGIILKSASGTRYRVTVADDGALTTTAL